MENSYIEVEQLLFGYSNGHHLLYSSTSLTERTEKILEVLSDLSGPDIQDGFLEYITGYPLESEKYYALSKTWYAPEMKRPGCVWTHTLLFKYEDLSKIKHCKNLFSLFVRPDVEFDNYNYSNSIAIDYYENYRLYNNISIERLRFIEWAIYTNDKPIIIGANNSEEYVNDIYNFWANQDEIFMEKFSFCTGALGNRNIERKTIDLQIVPYNLVRSVSRQNKELKVMDINQQKDCYPLWVDYMINPNSLNITSDFYLFRKTFGDKYLSKEYFSKFASIYTETGVAKGNARLEEFFNSISNIFLEIDAAQIKRTMILQLLKKHKLEWFAYTSIVDVILEMSTYKDLFGITIDSILLNEIIDLIWNDYYDDIKYIFRNLINNDINPLGEKIIKEFAIKASPDQLVLLTDMNSGLCNLMVKLDIKFALCEEIWHQTKDFQIEIINCIENNNNIELTQQVLNTILDNTQYEFCDLVYKKFGDIAISTYLDWYTSTKSPEDKKLKWIKLCEKSPYKCLQWIKDSDAHKDLSLLITIINILDPYSDEVLKIDNNFWINMYHNLRNNYIDDECKLILAKFFIPIILLKIDMFPEDFVRFSFNIIYDKIAKQEFEYYSWSKLEKILPEVPWYSAWDKCKRLRKAIKYKGYKI